MPESRPVSSLLALPGAVAIAVDGTAVAAGADQATTVAAHYGDPVGEQRMLVAGRAIVDLSDRGVITVSGPDRLTWLDSLTSQSLAALAPGQSAETLLLDPNGRLEHSIRIIDDGVTAWLLVDAAQTTALAAWLDRMRFMLRVEVADATADWATLGQLLPTGVDPLVVPAAPNGMPLIWHDPWSAVQAGGWQYAADDGHPAGEYPAVELLVERARLDEIAAAARAGDLAVAGTFALDALRIAAWRPRFGAEVDDRTIPHELDWLRSAVHLSKGCYRGQETVAKVHNLGHPPRRLVMLHLDGSDALLPGRGSPVLHEGAPVGTITSSARHHELGPIALAVVKRLLDPAAVLVVEADGVAIAAAQQVIVPPDAGATAGVPRIPRLGAVPRTG
ncbi:CAF17-like 4Fe-4S cluster assembly/insertion protein YgfZ [Microcella sp.]|uniref:CAF17-like 4Fe-4S cluster assembly/insertion protein YgfZ n=1 Tax=Microcella sp. TaxID=1913979 RepID=UPI003F730B5C